jgi:hypothetical protein
MHMDLKEHLGRLQQSSDSKRAAMNEMMRAAEVAADENMSTMHLINHRWGFFFVINFFCGRSFFGNGPIISGDYIVINFFTLVSN